MGDIGHVLNGYAFKAELFTRDGGMPLIRIRDVGSAASETFYSGEYDERYLVTAGDLLVGMDGDFNCARWRGARCSISGFARSLSIRPCTCRAFSTTSCRVT